MHHLDGTLQTSVESVSSGLLLLGCTAENQELGVLNVNVTQFVEPEVVDGGGGVHEVVVLQSLISSLGSMGVLVQNPLLDEREVLAGSVASRRDVVVAKTHESKLGGVVHLVAEFSVALDSVNIKVDVSTSGGVGTKGESHGVGTAFRDTVGERHGLSVLGLLDLSGSRLPWCSLACRSLRGIPEMTSRGSMTLPRDLDIFRPWASRTREWVNTSRKGMSPVSLIPSMIIRATQKKRISQPVSSMVMG